ncbi:MAG TPA: serine/threonine-protein kinase, partial [Polyangiaceae bacterium]|nr:serine/threonine-protein kinase [Polyangiaceae bacterium]
MRLEADALAKIEHENVVALHGSYETQQGIPFIVMELLIGQTLLEYLRANRAMPIRNALVCAVDLLNGLDAVHRLGIVHRDLKPSNLFLHELKDGVPVLKLLDFGAARVIPGISEDAPEPLALPTRTGTTIGTPRFMSPEAMAGSRVDVRSDIYAAANVIYYMLTGRGPFDDEDPADFAGARLTKPPPPPSRFAVEWIHPSLERAILKGLASDPDQRFQTAHEFSQAIYEVVLEYNQDPSEGKPRELEEGATESAVEYTVAATGARSARHLAVRRLKQGSLLLAILLASTAMGLYAIQEWLRWWI